MWRDRMLSVIHRLFAIIRPYVLHIGCVFIGCVGGWWGVLTGFVLAVLINRICKTKREQNAVIRFLHNPQSGTIQEPFPAAVSVCALCSLCIKDPLVIIHHFRRVCAPLCLSENLYKKIELYVYASVSVGDLNYDFLCEYTAAQFKKTLCLQDFVECTKAPLIVECCIRLLKSLEYAWDSAVYGLPPSAFLKELLSDVFSYIDNDKSCSSEDIANAYGVLGLSHTVSIRNVKKRYREYAAQYHPDTVSTFSDEVQKKAADEFIKIDGAYRLIVSHLSVLKDGGDE